MSLADPLILVILAVSGVLAMFRGFTLELLGLIALVLAALIAVVGFPLVHDLFGKSLPGGSLGTGLAIGGLFLIVLIPLWIVGNRLGGRIRESNMGFLDRSVGFAFGVLRGLFLLAIGYLVFTGFVGSKSSEPEWLEGSRLMPIVRAMGDLLVALAPDDSVVGKEFSLRPETTRALAGLPASDYIQL